MKTELYSISKIFTERLLRIPDYQRGYAWTERQYKDFWNDLLQLEDGNNHYTGVLTLEEVPQETLRGWPEDLWIIESKGFEPFYIVDGQQRLTTTIILIQAIIEAVPEGERLNYTTLDEIQKKFIFDSRDGGTSRSYIFGYDKDNPSYEFLKQVIFAEQSANYFPIQETIYTSNLENAKKFFAERLKGAQLHFLESLYKKLTQNFLFNAYAISKDVDVFIAFETMNNRGRPLSQLELLKNRLIYLSTKLEVDDHEKRDLRHSINESWKSIYHFLGKNKKNPLDDDVFLSTHSILHFVEEGKAKPVGSGMRIFRHGFSMANLHEYLLERKFSPKALSLRTNSEDGGEPLSVKKIHSYARSLKESVEIWYNLMNPQDSQLPSEEIEWLQKIKRIEIHVVAPIILVYFQKEKNSRNRLRLLKALERHLFVKSLYYDPFQFQPYSGLMLEKAIDLSRGSSQADRVVKEIEQITDSLLSEPEFLKNVILVFRSKGFYEWSGIRYFLFEYEQSLKSRSKTHREKLEWDVLSLVSITAEDERDYHTIEHIYPQRPRKPCWTSKFSQFTDRERSILRHSLGNLVPLSQPKNSSFQNNCFEDKVGRQGSTVGFRYGSYSGGVPA